MITERLFEALTFDDALLVPAYSEIAPSESDVRTRLTKKLSIKIPIVSSAMDTVTEWRMAISLARESGLPILATDQGMFDVCGVLYEKGLKGGM